MRRLFLIAASALAGVLGLAVTTPAGATAVHQAAADPVVGSWLFTSRRSSLPGLPAHSIVATPDGFDVVADESYKSGAPGGVTFFVLERASAFDDNPQCTIGSGTVVAHLRSVGTNSTGTRQYQGEVLKAQVSSSPSTCTLIGLQPGYYAFLAPWEDLTRTPPLVAGPYNRLCINDAPGTGSCYVSFDRKGGTAPAVVTTPTTAKPTAAPATGLSSLNAKIPPVAAFKADRVAPTVRAVASSGQAGRPFFLQYYAKDDRGFAGETYRIYRGPTLVKSWSVLAGERDGRLQRAPASLPANVKGQLTFCVGSQDLNRNRSPWSCAPLTIV